MPTKNRSNLIDDLAAHFSKLTKSDADFAVSTILDAMADALVAGHRIEIRGLGSFSVTRRPPRIAATHAMAKASPFLKSELPTSNRASLCVMRFTQEPQTGRLTLTINQL